MSAEKKSPPTTTPVRLLALHAQARPAVKELNQAVTILGGGEGADLILGSSRVDAAHTAIVSLPGGTYACDLGAPGGTLLGGRHIRWSRLADGDELSVGPFSFRVQLEDDLQEMTPVIPAFQLRNDASLGTVESSEAAMVIGSDPCCDILLAGPSISPRHALIAWTREGMILRDLTGRASVRHNGRAVQMSGIAEGDTVGVGPYELIFETQSTATSAEPPAETVSEAVSPPPAQPVRTAPVAGLAPPRGIAPTHWLDESHVEEEPSAIENEADDEAYEFCEEEEIEEIQSQVDEGLEMPEVMSPPRYSERNVSTDQFPPEVKARVVAAQRALDERARKLREELESERAQIKACQEKLQDQARQLLEAARQKQEEQPYSRSERASEYEETPEVYEAGESYEELHEEAPAHPAAYAPPPSRSLAPPDVAVLESIFAGRFDAAARPTTPEVRPMAAPSIRPEVTVDEEPSSLQQRVGELVSMVRDEKEEMYLAENRLESLRFEIDRLRGTVLRAKDKHQAQETEHEARYVALKRSLTAIRHERESLMTRIRRVDSKEATIAARVRDAERIRQDLETESERLNRAQEEHDERLRELRINLEGERHRLRVRQAELQRKAADLAKLARVRRKAIEEIVTRQQAELKDQESELKAKRSAVTEAGRAELERAATDLEQLLTARLADVETEVLTRQENLDNWLKAIWDSAKPITESPAATTAAASATSFKFEPFSSRLPGNAKIDGERGHMAILEKELEGLHRAVRKLEEDSERRGGWQESSFSAKTDRSTTSTDRRIDSVFTSKFSEKIASIRKGLIDLGTSEMESLPAASEKPVGMNS